MQKEHKFSCEKYLETTETWCREINRSAWITPNMFMKPELGHKPTVMDIYCCVLLKSFYAHAHAHTHFEIANSNAYFIL